jgi:drug/metabolite transporter (DMT)-like permease
MSHQPDSTPPPPNPVDAAAQHVVSLQTRGMWLGALAVALFAMTLPMTRLATGTNEAPQLSPMFVTLGRAAVAGLISAVLLLVQRAPWPRREQRVPLLMAMLGNTIGYPLMLGYALRSVTASHAAVVIALLPLATAAIAAWVLHQRASRGFWLCAVAGSGLVIAFSLLRGGGGFIPDPADLLLVGAVVAASVGYVFGAQITPALGGLRVICWATALALPVTIPATLLLWPSAPVVPHAWLGFAYVSLFSMWIGMFVWFRALNLGGALRVSQMLLLQPFLTIVFAIPILGERLDPVVLLFAVAVIATVLLGRRLGQRTTTA